MSAGPHQVIALDDVVRTVHEFLRDNGFHGTAACLQRESLVSCRTFAVAEHDEFRDAVMQGSWDVALRYCDEALLSDAALAALWEAVVLDLNHRAALALAGRPLPGVDGATAQQYAIEIVRRHPVLLKLKAAEQARYARLAAKAQQPAMSAEEPSTWRGSAWAAIDKEILVVARSVESVEPAAAETPGDRWVALLQLASAQMWTSETAAADQRKRAPSLSSRAQADSETGARRMLVLAARQLEARGGPSGDNHDMEQRRFEGSVYDRVSVLLKRPSCIASAPNSAVALVGCEGGTAALISTAVPVVLLGTWPAVPTSTTAAGILTIVGVTLHRAGDAFLCGLRDGHLVCLSATEALPVVWASQQPFHSLGVTCAACVRDNAGRDIAVSGSFDATLRVFDASTGRIMKSLRGHTAPVSSAIMYIAAGSVRAVSCASDGTLRLWDCISGSESALAVVVPWSPNTPLLRIRRQPQSGAIVVLRGASAADGGSDDGFASFAVLSPALDIQVRQVPSERSKLRADASEVIITSSGALLLLNGSTHCAYYTTDPVPLNTGSTATERTAEWKCQWEKQLVTEPATAESGARGLSQGPVIAATALDRCVLVKNQAVILLQ